MPKNKIKQINSYRQKLYDLGLVGAYPNKIGYGNVSIKDNKKLIRNYEKFCTGNKSTLQTNIDDLFKLQNDLSELITNLKEKGDDSGLKKEIENLQTKIKDSHQGENFSKDELNEFEGFKKEILRLEQLQKILEKDKNEVSILKDEDLFDSFNCLSDVNEGNIEFNMPVPGSGFCVSSFVS